MENFTLQSDERQKMLEFTAQVQGSVNEDWTDREILEHYNESLAKLFLALSRKAR